MKNLILFLIVFAFATQLSAQMTGIGIRPALTLSKYKLAKDYNDIYDVNLRPGASFAVFAEFNLGNRITFQPEIAFTQRGGNIKNESNVYWDGAEFGYNRRDAKVVGLRQRESLNYLDIPLMVEKNFGGGNFGAYIAAGPALSFALGNGKGLEELTVTYTTEDGVAAMLTDRNEYTIEMGNGRNDDYRAYDFSLNLGTGLIYILETGELSFDVRYTHGMRNVDVGGIKNRNFQFGLSYMYYFNQ